MPHPKLQKTLTWTQGTAMTVGAVLGTGVLVLPATTAIMAGPASLISWLIMAILTLPLALTLGQLAISYPNAGGVAAYARQAFGPLAGTLTGWLFLGTTPIGGPIAALIGVAYISPLFNLSPSSMYVMAALILYLGLFLNYRGIKIAGWAQVGVIVVICSMLTAAAGASLPLVKGEAFHPFLPHGWLPIGTAMTILFWAFVGWEMMAHLTEEFKNPARDIPRTVWASVLIVDILYLLVAFATVGTASYLGEGALAPLTVMIQKGWGSGAATITALLGFLVCYGTSHTYIAGFSRLLYAQAREGDFPAYLSRLHPTFSTPHLALISMGVAYTIVLSLSYFFKLNLGSLMQWVCAIFIVVYIIAMAAAWRLFHDRPMIRFLAGISLVTCLIILFFTGTVVLYPLTLMGLGYLSYKRKEQQKGRHNV